MKVLTNGSQEKQAKNSQGWVRLAKREFSREVPDEYKNARLADFKRLDRGSIHWDKYGFCLRGNTGIGKTHLATALACEYFNPKNKMNIASKSNSYDGEHVEYSYRDNCFKWISAPSLLCRIRSSFCNSSSETEYDIVQEVIKSKLLLLDDLGAEKSSDYSASTLYAILSERRNYRRITIVTTNQTLQDINRWEPRIASRLAELETVSLPDVDRRVVSSARGANA